MTRLVKIADAYINPDKVFFVRPIFSLNGSLVEVQGSTPDQYLRFTNIGFKDVVAILNGDDKEDYR